MANSSKPERLKKPSKKFPLTPRGDGRWCKKIAGKLRYIKGSADEALAEWLRVKDYWLNGLEAPEVGTADKPADDGQGIKVGELVNLFLLFKQGLVDNGELAPRTYARYETSGKWLIGELGRYKPVVRLTTLDFQALRARMAKKWGLVALANEVQIVRSIFKYGFDADLLAAPVKFGPGFKKPSPKSYAKQRAELEAQHGKRLFTAEQIRTLLALTEKPQTGRATYSAANMRAMVLLAINAGLGNSDLGELTLKPFDLVAGWLDYPRVKTATPRRIPLWPETVAAVQAVIKARREPATPEDADKLFIGARGESYAGTHKGYRVAQEFAHLLEAAKIEGRSFYDFRRTFATVASGSLDQISVDAIMGHIPPATDMSARYRQEIDDARLRAVVDHVHRWLFPVEAKPAKKTTKAKA